MKEYTTSYIMQGYNYIINMTSVNIDSYSTGLNSPANAIIYAINDDISVFSSTSVMNLLANDTLKLNEVFINGSVPINDQQRLLTANINIFFI